MIKYQMSGFNDFDELVILEVLAEDYESAPSFGVINNKNYS